MAVDAKAITGIFKSKIIIGAFVFFVAAIFLSAGNLKVALKEFYYAMLIPVSCAMFLRSLVSKQINGGFFRKKWIRFLGKISYGIYLYHLPVFFAFGISHMQKDSAVGLDAAILALCVSFFCAIISWYLIEKPLLALKDKISSSA